MAHFAKVNLDKIVEQVVVVNNSILLDENGIEKESKGVEFLNSIFGFAQWVQTSYNGSFRKQYAGIGFTYDDENDIFISIKPYESWILNEDFEWEAPTEYPNDNKTYVWNEDTLTWDLYTNP